MVDRLTWQVKWILDLETPNCVERSMFSWLRWRMGGLGSLTGWHTSESILLLLELAHKLSGDLSCTADVWKRLMSVPHSPEFGGTSYVWCSYGCLLTCSSDLLPGTRQS